MGTVSFYKKYGNSFTKACNSIIPIQKQWSHYPGNFHIFQIYDSLFRCCRLATSSMVGITQMLVDKLWQSALEEERNYMWLRLCVPDLLSFSNFSNALHADLFAVFLSVPGHECLWTTPFASTSTVMMALPFIRVTTGSFMM